MTDARTKEYLKRNLEYSRSIGTAANLKHARARLRKQSRPPKWLMALLDDAIERIESLQEPLLVRRNEVSTSPQRRG